ncbi:MAG: glycosyltransferase family 4 protein [Candidatus Woesearchaeota archaeon]|nr:glycosyltransferase family 4 protein [Candidatus Woesearchaeota archaeon]
MKVLILCPDWFPNISGFAMSCYEFSQRLIKDGHQVKILVPSQKDLDKKGLDVVPVWQVFNLLGRNPVLFGLLGALRKHSQDADVILLYSYMYEMNFRAVFYRWLGLIKKPMILLYRGSLEDYFLPLLSPVTRFAKIIYDNTMGRFLFRHSDCIISNSKPTLDVINKKYGVNYDKMSYVSSAVEVKEFKHSSLNNKRIIFNGRLIENKGIKFFEKIVSNIPKDWKFTIVGDGPMKDVVLDLQNKFSNIELLGKISYEDTKKIYSKSDILVLPTFAEGSPRVVLEACAAGVPSVVFDVGDVPTLMDGDKNGYCVSRYNIDDFITKMKVLIKDSALRKKKGANARSFAEKTLDWEIVYKRMVDEIKKVI